MKTEEFLGQIESVEERIAVKRARIVFWRELATSITAPIENYGRSTEVSRKVERCVHAIMELEESILADIQELTSAEYEVRQAIHGVANPKYRSILEKRYILRMPIEQIAVSEHYTYRWTQTLIKRAVAALKESM